MRERDDLEDAYKMERARNNGLEGLLEELVGLVTYPNGGDTQGQSGQAGASNEAVEDRACVGT